MKEFQKTVTFVSATRPYISREVRLHSGLSYGGVVRMIQTDTGHLSAQNINPPACLSMSQSHSFGFYRQYGLLETPVEMQVFLNRLVLVKLNCTEESDWRKRMRFFPFLETEYSEMEAVDGGTCC